ncbi:hypothetical protein DFJ73DRAFT_851508, partial [Zopfochytrium polystomum]
IVVGGSASFELPASTFSTFPGTFLHERTQRILHFNNPLTIDLPDCSPAVFRKVVLPFYDTSRPWEFPLAPWAPVVPPPIEGSIGDIVAAAIATANGSPGDVFGGRGGNSVNQGDDKHAADDEEDEDVSGDLNPFQIDHDLHFLCIPSPFDMRWSAATFFTTDDGRRALARSLQAARCVLNDHHRAAYSTQRWRTLVEDDKVPPAPGAAANPAAPPAPVPLDHHHRRAARPFGKKTAPAAEAAPKRRPFGPRPRQPEVESAVAASLSPAPAIAETIEPSLKRAGTNSEHSADGAALVSYTASFSSFPTTSSNPASTTTTTHDSSSAAAGKTLFPSTPFSFSFPATTTFSFSTPPVPNVDERVFKILVGESDTFELPASTFTTFPGTLLHERTQRILQMNEPLAIDLPDCSPAVFRRVVLPFYDTSRPWDFSLQPAAPVVSPPTKGDDLDAVIAATATAVASADDVEDDDDNDDMNPFQIDDDLRALRIPSPFDLAWSFSTFSNSFNGKRALVRLRHAAFSVDRAHRRAVAVAEMWVDLVERHLRVFYDGKTGRSNPFDPVLVKEHWFESYYYQAVSAMPVYAMFSFEEWLGGGVLLRIFIAPFRPTCFFALVTVPSSPPDYRSSACKTTCSARKPPKSGSPRRRSARPTTTAAAAARFRCFDHPPRQSPPAHRSVQSPPRCRRRHRLSRFSSGRRRAPEATVRCLSRGLIWGTGK